MWQLSYLPGWNTYQLFRKRKAHWNPAATGQTARPDGWRVGGAAADLGPISTAA
jgi:hypothetical protein